MNRVFAIFIAVISTWHVQSAVAGQYILYMESSSGDYIGQGQTWSYTDTDVPFRTTQNYQNGVSIYLNRYDSGNWISWNLDFASVTSVPLQPGYYGDTSRYPFNTYYGPSNGLSVSGMGRGCNRLFGEFTVREIQYNAAGVLDKFAVDFKQICEEFMPPLVGSLRYNSDIPINALLPPEISFDKPINSAKCIEAEGPEGTNFHVIAKTPQDDGGFVYSWSLEDGTTVSGNTLDLLVGVNEGAFLNLTVSDPSTGKTAAVSRTICVSDTTPPNITIQSPRPGDIFVGNNLKLDALIKDAVDIELSTYKVFMGTSITFHISDGETHQSLSKPGQNGEPYLTTITIEATDMYGNTARKSVDVVQQHDKRRI